MSVRNFLDAGMSRERGRTDNAGGATARWTVFHHLLILLLIIGIAFTLDFKIMRPAGGVLYIRTDDYIGEVSAKYLSIAIDTSFLKDRNMFNIMSNKSLRAMVKALSPAFLRIGGNAADLLIFKERLPSKKKNKLLNENNVNDKNFHKEKHLTQNCQITQPLSALYMSGDEWLALNDLANTTQNNLLFDLNVLLRNEDGEWDSTNAQQLLKFSQDHGLKVDWQLGNEPNAFCHKFGYSLSPKQLGIDFKSLSALLSNYIAYNNSKLVGPDVTRPLFKEAYTMKSTLYLHQFLLEAESVLSAVAWHQYYLNGRTATARSFLDPVVLNVLPKQIRVIKEIVANSTKRPVPIWISETSSAYGGGAPGLSDRFLASFMWLDKLGLAATFNVSVVIRQSLLGNNYGLIDHHSLEPNPDFWVSLIYKKLVGRRVLSVSFDKKDPEVRFYAHCAKKEAASHEANPIVIFGMNLGDSPTSKHVSGYENTSSHWFIELYVLTSPRNESLLSKAINLNGRRLKLTPCGHIPTMDPIVVKDTNLHLPAHSMIFAVIHGIFPLACEP